MPPTIQWSEEGTVTASQGESRNEKGSWLPWNYGRMAFALGLVFTLEEPEVGQGIPSYLPWNTLVLRKVCHTARDEFDHVEIGGFTPLDTISSKRMARDRSRRDLGFLTIYLGVPSLLPSTAVISWD